MARAKLKERRRNLFQDGFEVRNNRVYFRLTSKARTELGEVWKSRTYPNPTNPNESLKFRSEQEYLEFIVRALNSCHPKLWNIFKHFLNPDFREED